MMEMNVSAVSCQGPKVPSHIVNDTLRRAPSQAYYQSWHVPHRWCQVGQPADPSFARESWRPRSEKVSAVDQLTAARASAQQDLRRSLYHPRNLIVARLQGSVGFDQIPSGSSQALASTRGKSLELARRVVSRHDHSPRAGMYGSDYVSGPNVINKRDRATKSGMTAFGTQSSSRLRFHSSTDPSRSWPRPRQRPPTVADLLVFSIST